MVCLFHLGQEKLHKGSEGKRNTVFKRGNTVGWGVGFNSDEERIKG